MHQTLVERASPARRATENSPAFQRWDSGARGEQVPSGTKERSYIPPVSLSPLRGLGGFVDRCPSDESLGYFRSSLTGLCPSGRTLQGAAPTGAHLPAGRQVNAYAQAVIRTLPADEHQRGCLMEQRREIRSPKSEGEARRRRGTVRPAGHAPDAGGARFPSPEGERQ